MLGVLTHIQIIINKLGERTLLALMGMFTACLWFPLYTCL